jgi:hypothetical protein
MSDITHQLTISNNLTLEQKTLLVCEAVIQDIVTTDNPSHVVETVLYCQHCAKRINHFRKENLIHADTCIYQVAKKILESPVFCGITMKMITAVCQTFLDLKHHSGDVRVSTLDKQGLRCTVFWKRETVRRFAKELIQSMTSDTSWDGVL